MSKTNKDKEETKTKTKTSKVKSPTKSPAKNVVMKHKVLLKQDNLITDWDVGHSIDNMEKIRVLYENLGIELKPEIKQSIEKTFNFIILEGLDNYYKYLQHHKKIDEEQKEE